MVGTRPVVLYRLNITESTLKTVYSLDIRTVLRTGLSALMNINEQVHNMVP